MSVKYKAHLHPIVVGSLHSVLVELTVNMGTRPILQEKIEVEGFGCPGYINYALRFRVCGNSMNKSSTLHNSFGSEGSTSLSYTHVSWVVNLSWKNHEDKPVTAVFTYSTKLSVNL